MAMQDGMLMLQDCDCGISINGVNYSFTHHNNVKVEDPEKQHLTRGASGASKTGLVYKEGVNSPKIMTFNLKGMTAALFTLLSKQYKDGARLEAWCIDRDTGSHITAKDAVIQAEPRQLNIDQGEDSLMVDFVVETFNLVKVDK